MDVEQFRKDFSQLTLKDRDLTMFTTTSLTLTKKETGNMVYMALKLKRKVATELLTTYLPTILLLLITFVTIFFDKDMFGDAIAVNLTIMLVMTTIFTSKIEELPPTSDMKMIDVWLIFCLVVPFLEVILRTAIECSSCSCQICELEVTNKAKGKKGDKKKEKVASSGVWVGTGAKVAPAQKVEFYNYSGQNIQMCFPWQVLKKDQEEATVEAIKEKEEFGGHCSRKIWQRCLHVTGDQFISTFIEKGFCYVTVNDEEHLKDKFFLETWILPSAVGLAMVAYAVLAIVFYNNDNF